MTRKTIIIAATVFLLGCIGTIHAYTALEKEEPQEIRGIIVEYHDSLWYETQQQLWLQKTAEDPTDEHAWREAYLAARYVDMLADNWGRTVYKHKQAVLDSMSEYIPNSFTYNLCMYDALRDRQPGDDPEPYIQKALQLMPENIDRKDAEVLLVYLWDSGKTFAKDKKPNAEQQLQTKLAQKLYETNAYPSYLIRYTYNSLQGMDENAIYFYYADVPAYTSLIIQEALHQHTDKVIVNASFLFHETYRKAVCNYLGIKDFEVTKDYASIENWIDVYKQDILEHIINNSKRPAYFYPTSCYPETESFKKNLYNEGLVLKYSTHSYDNMAVAKRNVESKYHMQYLTEPGFTNEEQWVARDWMQLNYMVMLTPVVKSYKEEGDTLHANQLARYLTAAIVQTSLSDDKKMKYINLLDDKDKK